MEWKFVHIFFAHRKFSLPMSFATPHGTGTLPISKLPWSYSLSIKYIFRNFVPFGAPYMCTKLENGVLTTDSNHSVVNSFIEQGEFEAMKLLSGWEAARSRKKERKKERRRKMALMLLHTFAFSCLPCGFWATIWVLLITKHSKSKPGRKNKPLAYLWWSYTAFG